MPAGMQETSNGTSSSFATAEKSSLSMKRQREDGAHAVAGRTTPLSAMKFDAIVIADDYRRLTTLVAPDIEAAMSDLRERHAPDVSEWNVSVFFGQLECSGISCRHGNYHICIWVG